MKAKISVLSLLILCVHLTTFAQNSNASKLSIGLNTPGEVLIISPDGKKLGFDAVAKKSYDEIKGATVSTARDREPVHRVPISDAAKDLTIRVFGKTARTKGDLAISGDGFTLRAVGLALEPKTVFTIILRPNLSSIRFSANSPVENPGFNLAIDPPSADEPSYIFKLSRSRLGLKKIVKFGLDLSAGTFDFGDNVFAKSTYSLQVTKIAASGEQVFDQSKIVSNIPPRFQFDFKNWDEKTAACLKIDENADGFADEQCENPSRLNN